MEPDTLRRSWLKSVGSGQGLTNQEFAALVNRLDGSEGDTRTVIRSFTDVELLQFWYATRRAAEDLPDTDFPEIEEFCMNEMLGRADASLTLAG